MKQITKKIKDLRPGDLCLQGSSYSLFIGFYKDHNDWVQIFLLGHNHNNVSVYDNSFWKEESITCVV